MGEEYLYRVEKLEQKSTFLLCICKSLEEAKEKIRLLTTLTNEVQIKNIVVYKVTEKENKLVETYLFLQEDVFKKVVNYK